ncbi:MAG: STAS domain-containing protein [Solirubrobacteraceae bacterium]
MKHDLPTVSAETPLWPPLEIDVKPMHPSGRVMTLRGELCVATSGLAQRSMEDKRLDGDDAPIVLDLRELSFMDSTGVRLLLALEGRFTAAGRGFSLLVGEGASRRTLQIVGLEAHPPRADAHAVDSAVALADAVDSAVALAGAGA